MLPSAFPTSAKRYSYHLEKASSAYKTCRKIFETAENFSFRIKIMRNCLILNFFFSPAPFHYSSCRIETIRSLLFRTELLSWCLMVSIRNCKINSKHVKTFFPYLFSLLVQSVFGKIGVNPFSIRRAYKHSVVDISAISIFADKINRIFKLLSIHRS